MNNRLRSCFEWYLTKKIGTEIKCCLIFFLSLCFYGAYRWLMGNRQVDILPMVEMVLIAYASIWVQIFMGADFDEADRLGIKEWLIIILVPAIYAIAARLGHWYGNVFHIEVGFFVYMVVAYLCTYLIYYIKRAIDAKLLNNDLKRFQQRNI